MILEKKYDYWNNRKVWCWQKLSIRNISRKTRPYSYRHRQNLARGLSFDESKQFLLNEFGTEIFDNGILNRKLLGKIVFADQEKLDKLNNFCQIEMEKKIDEIISNSKKSLILDYALLCGLRQFKLCDVKILLKADLDTRYSRVKERENISKEYFISRDNSLSDFNENDFDYVYHHITENETNLLIKNLKTRI